MRSVSRALLLATTVTLAGVGTSSAFAGELAPRVPAAPGQATKPTRFDPAKRKKPSLDRSDIRAAWQKLPTTGSGCGDDLIFDYGVDGGMRNFFCRALTVFSWNAFVKMAPTTPFRAGPHKGTRLELKAERDFGRYNPAFVKWATEALVPGADDAAFREATQGVYDQQMRTLARLYVEVDERLRANPQWVEAERQFYLGKMDQKGGGWDVWEVTDLYHNTLGTSDENWGGNDPNHVRSATMWWLRRHHDGTADLWREGLHRLVGAYDGSWLKGTLARGGGPVPARPTTAPEYR